MNIPFSAYCIFVMVLVILTIIGIAPLMWDATGYVEDVLNNAYRVEFAKVVTP